MNPNASRHEVGAKIGYLSAVSIFKDLKKEDMEWLDHATTQITCPKGRLIYSPGQSDEVLYLLKKGAVELYRLSPDGRKLVVARLGDHTFFGEMSLLGQGMYQSFAEATSDSLLCAMSRTDVERLILTKPIVGLRVLEVLGKRLGEVESMLDGVVFRRLSSRLAAVLLQLSREQSGPSIAGFTHQGLAELVGSTRETVTQTLHELKMQGLIDIARTRIEILDPQGLDALADLDR